MKKLILLFLFTATLSFSQWSIQSSNTNLGINSVCFVNANTGYAVGDNSKYFKTTNGGQNWGSLIIPGANINLDVIHHRDPDAGLATGRNYIFSTTNGGINWAQTIFNPKYRIRNLYYVGSGKVYAAAYEYNGAEDTIVNARILLTTNYGANWTEVSSIAIDEPGACCKPKKPAIIFVDNNTGYLATLKGIYKTSNGGNFFSQIDNRVTYTVDAMGTGLVMAGVSDGNNLLVIKSTNQGANWQQIASIPNTGGSKGFSGMRLLPTVNKIYLTVSSTDSGSDFTQQDSSIYASYDNGLSWFCQSIPVTNTNIFSIDFIDGNTGWAVGSGGTILKTINGGGNPIGIHMISSEIPKRYTLSQNYPNPFNPMTNIKYQIIKNGFVSIKIFDVLGEEVAEIVSEQLNPGTYEVNWDASGYPSGIYFYRMEVQQLGSSISDFTETKKMVLIK